MTVNTATTDGVTLTVGPGLKPGTSVNVTMVGCDSTVTGTATVGADGNAIVSIIGAVECTYTATITGTKADGTAYTNTSQIAVGGLEDTDDSDSDAGDDSTSTSDDTTPSTSTGGIADTGAGDSVTLLTVGLLALVVGGTAVLVARSRRWGKDAA